MPVPVNAKNDHSALQTCFAILSLIGLSLVPYHQVIGFDFVNLDDNFYVTANPYVLQGLTLPGILWAFSTLDMANWHPLTWISHMADVSYFGLAAGRHHFVNLISHLLNTVLLFLFLKMTSRALWRSAMVAALFAIHPLHVQSVVWVAERKDVLSSFFWMTTLLAYAHYRQWPSKRSYGFVLLNFGLGLMSKAMVVTLPLILLFLDEWPLERMKDKGIFFMGRWKEKVPLFLMSGVLSLLTFIAQGKGNAIRTDPWLSRVENTFLAYGIYLKQCFWPSKLSVSYPFVSNHVEIKAGLAALGVVGISGMAIRFRRRWPYLFAGWFWYLITLLPVIGLFPIGWQLHADRYTYIPLIGIFIIVVWGLYDLGRFFKSSKTWLMIISVIPLTILTLRTYQETSYWENSTRLLQRAVDLDPSNYTDYYLLGLAYYKDGRYAEALDHLNIALNLRPANPDWYLHLNHIYALNASMKLHQLDQPGRVYDLVFSKSSEEVQAHPDMSASAEQTELYQLSALSHYHLGEGFEFLRQDEKAEEEYKKALAFNPRLGDAHNSLGILLADKGKLDEAKAHIFEALRVLPENSEVLKNLKYLETLIHKEEKTNALN